MKSDVFLHDFGAGATELISMALPTLPSVTPLGLSGLGVPSVNSNGQFVAFTSESDGVVSGDTNGCWDVFAHDFGSGSNILVSASLDGAHSGNAGSFDSSISADGRYVVFSSYATNLVADDSNGFSDIFLRDLQTGSTSVLSVDATGANEGNGNSFTPQISANGNYVMFYSVAGNLANVGQSGGLLPRVFWRDLQAGVTYSITGATNVTAMTPNGSNVLFGAGAALYLWNAGTHNATNLGSFGATVSALAISPDARHAAFTTTTNVYAFDLVAQTNWLLGTMVPTSAGQFQFSADGRRLAYLAKDSAGTNQLRLYDFSTASNILVSQSYNSAMGGNATSDSPAVSASGRFVAYRSAASNLVPGDTNGVPDIFLFDRLTGGTTLISVSQFGPFPANSRSLAPVFSADGQTLLFESWASDLAPGDFNEASDVFALILPGGSTNEPPPVTLSANAAGTNGNAYTPGQPFMLAWPSVAGAGYQVQYKNALTDPQWEPLTAPATVVGGRGSMIDTSPDPLHRFYRIVSF